MPLRVWTALSAAFLFAACTAPSVSESPAPELVPLDVVVDVRSEGDFRVSGVAWVGPCTIWVVGERWGLLVEIDLSSGAERVLGHLPGRPAGGRLSAAPGGEVVWAGTTNPPALFFVRIKSKAATAVVVPPHPWTNRALLGSIAALQRGVVVAPLGAELTMSPRPWVEAPIAWVVDQRGDVNRQFGLVRDAGGRYLSAATAAVAIGESDGRLGLLDLHEARLAWYSSDSITTPDTVVQLPRYLHPPASWEDVWTVPWLDIGADQPRAYAVPQLVAASIGNDGSLWVVRNRRVSWDATDSRLGRSVYATPGTWRVGGQWLEAIDPDGVTRAAFDLGDGGVRNVESRDAKTAFLIGPGRSLRLVQRGSDAGVKPRCETGFRPTISINASDSPYDLHELSAVKMMAPQEGRVEPSKSEGRSP